MPIKALNKFSYDWIIKAWVTYKGPIKYSHKGNQVFKIELLDCCGTVIECVFFENANVFYE